MVRKYGSSPFKAAVIHGGPGAPGYMAPVARELSKTFGVLEPIQVAKSLDGQISELQQQLITNCKEPICLIGSSWGATLALFYSAEFKELVNKVIIVGSCVYDSDSSEKVKSIRAKRMSEEDTRTCERLTAQLKNANDSEKNEIFSQLADCSFDSDTYDPITRDLEILNCDFSTNKLVWTDFKKIRDTPKAIKSIFSKIDVPVVNIHGDYDPHIVKGVQPFLESCISNIKLHTLNKCSHYPWIEKYARNQFYDLVRSEVAQS